ncbi:MAG: GTPase HflX [Alteromonadaceae bacterium]|nr:MAG: GTPase HflX [Alteromonadaceae bacterium]
MFFDRPDSGELAILVHLQFTNKGSGAIVANDPREFEELVLSAGGDPVTTVTGSRFMPSAKFFIGTGKLDELAELVQLHCAGLVIFNHELSASQERNIEEVLKCRVLDRVGLILDIFAQRARTYEGKLQVELAQLQHASTRLVRGWTHLERQKGGIGLRGPGETQLESDRRLLRERIKAIQKRMTRLRSQRDQGRRSRSRADVATVSLVGYTNAGKSTLFNSLTDANVYVEDQLFATLDPTMRRIPIANAGHAVLADTVGFISNLPHRLVQAFRATLEEASKADLLLHVIDVVDEERKEHIEQVNLVLEEIEAGDIPCLLVYNKVDMVPDGAARLDRSEDGKPCAVWLSAQSGVGLDLLREALSELLAGNVFHQVIGLKADQARFRARLHQHNSVICERYDEVGTCQLEVKIPESDLLKMLSAESFGFDDIEIIDADMPKSD